MSLPGIDPWTFRPKAQHGVSAPRLSLMESLVFVYMYLQVPGEVMSGTLKYHVQSDCCFLPMLWVTVLETSTEMLSETIVRKQMARFWLSCTILSYGPGWALNMYHSNLWLKLKPWSLFIVTDLILSFRFYLSSWQHVLMLVDLLFISLWLIYCWCLYFYATVKRPAVFPLTHT